MNYSVAQHSFFISLYTKLFADLENEWNKTRFEKRIDTLKAIEMALVHDLEESVTGDLLYPFKHGVGLTDELRKQLSQAIDNIIDTHVDEELFKELPTKIKDAYKRLWRRSKTEGIEGELVEAMDKFEILIFALQEMGMGNMQMRPIYITAMTILLSRYNKFHTLVTVLLDIDVYYLDNFIDDCCRKEEDTVIKKLVDKFKDERGKAFKTIFEEG